MITLTPHQEFAFVAIKDFLVDDSSQVFILKGYAGTGKTTLIHEVIKYVQSLNNVFYLMAPTGRAAKIISEKTGVKATTIHKCIYCLKNKAEILNEDQEVEQLRHFFELRDNSDCVNPICIVDESSMIGTNTQKGEYLMFGSGSLLNDLMTFANLDKKGKIIFVGDSAQLPPVGDSKSNALDIDFFTPLGLKVKSIELSEVIRQDKDSLILSNSLKLRKLISEGGNRLIFDCDNDQVIKTNRLVDNIKRDSEFFRQSDSIVITYTNADALIYNNIIRSCLFPGKSSLTKGDRLVFTANIYASDHVLLNGDFAEVLSCSDKLEFQTSPVYVNEKGSKVKKDITLSFRDVELKLSDGQIIKSKIIDSLLYSKKPNITPNEQTSLHVNFKIRHNHIKDKEELKLLYRTDPFVNAIRAKFGYAITGHKSQGGEWSHVYSDFYNRALINSDCLRWMYTVVTRAKTQLIAASLPNITEMSKLRFDPISKTLIPKEAFDKLICSSKLQAKYDCLNSLLSDTEYSIESVEHAQYREIYHIQTPLGLERYDGIYNRSEIVWFNTDSTKHEVLRNALNDNTSMSFNVNYHPTEETLINLSQKVFTLCSDLNLIVANVIENVSSYKVTYIMVSLISIIRIDFYFNAHHQLTYASPQSNIGDKDTYLAEFVSKF